MKAGQLFKEVGQVARGSARMLSSKTGRAMLGRQLAGGIGSDMRELFGEGMRGIGMRDRIMGAGASVVNWARGGRGIFGGGGFSRANMMRRMGAVALGAGAVGAAGSFVGNRFRKQGNRRSIGGSSLGGAALGAGVMGGIAGGALLASRLMRR